MKGGGPFKLGGGEEKLPGGGPCPGTPGGPLEKFGGGNGPLGGNGGWAEIKSRELIN